ncbi:MAG TPA: SH3 domain-containing protein [Anaeromyxobacter sp.]|nr:SH3 domain-containing protein [Anaeromyxobacter sp.]
MAVLRREASEAAKVKRGGKELANFLAQLHRGEKVAVLETREDWAKVRSSDDSEGWIKRSSLIESQGLSEATVLAPADVFDRPDLLAANARRRVEAGTLVLVVRSRPPFSEVNVSGGQNAWVLTDRLNTSDKEVSVAKLAEQARYLLRNNKKDEALKLLALARERFDGAALVNVLAAELGEAPVEPPTPASAAPTTDPLSPDASGPQ